MPTHYQQVKFPAKLQQITQWSPLVQGYGVHISGSKSHFCFISCVCWKRIVQYVGPCCNKTRVCSYTRTLREILFIQLFSIYTPSPRFTNAYTVCYYFVLIKDYILHGIHTWGPLYQHGLTLIPAWIRDYMNYKMWGEITYPFPLISSHNHTGHILTYLRWDLN